MRNTMPDVIVSVQTSHCKHGMTLDRRFLFRIRNKHQRTIDAQCSA